MTTSTITTAQIVTLLTDILGESSTQAAANAGFWSGLAANASYSTLPSLAAVIATSPEVSIIEQVYRLYEGVLGRAPDASGLQYWVQQAESGLNAGQISLGTSSVPAGTWNTITSSFINSTEFQTEYAGIGNAAFVTLLYKNVLNRAPDAGGLLYWTGLLVNGTSKTSVVEGFVNSTEYQSDVNGLIVNSLVSGALGDTGSGATYTNITVSLAPATIILTTGADIVTGSSSVNNFVGVLGTTGATLNGFDIITGGTGATNTLTLTDSTGTTADVIPVGLTISNIQTVTLTTAGEAGSLAQAFNTTGISGVTALNVTSYGNATDYVKAAATTNVTVNAFGTVSNGLQVSISGGLADTVTAIGGATITGAAGAVSVTDTGTAGTGGAISVTGGTTVTITTSDTTGVFTGTAAGGANSGGLITVTDTAATGALSLDGGGTAGVTVTSSSAGTITIGDGSSAADGTVGAITVTDTSNGAITINDGSAVTVTTAGSAVTIGSTYSPTGAVSVTETVATSNAITINGGTSVSVTSGGAGSITIGAATAPTGAITVTDKAFLSTNGVNAGATIATTGGTAVTISTVGASYNASSLTVTPGSVTVNTPTGAVSITDSEAFNANKDVFTVTGGTTVSVVSTPSTGNVIIGAAPASATTTNASSDPTGNVTVTELGTNTVATITGTTYTTAATPVYGTGVGDTIYTNGAKVVSLTGANTATIADVEQTTSGSATIGTSTLATVNLTGVTNATIDSGVLSALNITNTSSATVTVGATGALSAEGAHTLALGLTGDTTVGLTDTTATAITVNSAGATAESIYVNGSKLTSLTFNDTDTAAITVTGVTLNSTVTGNTNTITVTGSGAINLGDLTNSSLHLGSISVSGTGAVSAAINGALTSFVSTGSGNDTVTVSGGLGATITGGSGANTLVLNDTAADLQTVLNQPYSSLATNFQTLALGSAASGSYVATGFTALKVLGGTAGNVTFANTVVGTPLTIAAPDIFTITDGFGSGGSFNLTLGTDGTAASVSANLTEGGAVGVTVNSVGVNALANTNALTLTDSSAITSLTVTGDEAFTFTDTAGATALTKITVTDSATVTINGASDISTTGVTLTGGAGLVQLDVNSLLGASGSINAVDSYTAGTGGLKLVLGAGGASISATNSTATGSETVNLGGETTQSYIAVLDQPKTGTAFGTNATIAGWHDAAAIDTALGKATADVLNFGGTTHTGTNSSSSNITGGAYSETGLTVIANATGVVEANATYSIANGVFTTTSTLSAAAELADVKAALNAAGTGEIGLFVNGGTTYIVATPQTGTGTAASDDLILLTGVSATGFGNVGSASTVLIADTLTYGSSATSVSVATSATYSDTGYAVQALTGAGGSTAATATTVTLTGLGGVATITDAAATSGYVNLNSTQASAGSALILSHSGAETLNTLTVSNDAALYLNATSALTVSTIVDGTTVNTLKTLVIEGSQAVTIGAITDTALTLIDANAASNEGFLTNATSLTAVLTLGSSSAAITQTGLTIDLGAYSSTVYASGAGDTITSVATGTSDTITASGAGDTITLADTTSGNTITASGAGDTITVGAGTDSVTAGASAKVTVGAAGFGADTIVVGANSTVDLAGGNNAAIGVTVGANSTVLFNATPNALDTINVTAAVTGATASGSFAQTTLVGPGVYSNNVHLTFAGSSNTGADVSTGFVNVAGQTTLAGALNLAASESNAGGTAASGTNYYSWFQYQGNTYVVDHVGGGAKAESLTAADHVVEIVGLYNLNNFATTGTHSIIL